jgi:hypothetical protein
MLMPFRQLMKTSTRLFNDYGGSLIAAESHFNHNPNNLITQ